MTEAFMARGEAARLDAGRGAERPRMARLEPGGRIGRAPIGLGTFEERGLGCPPPAA